MNELHIAAGKKNGGFAEVKTLVEEKKADVTAAHTETKLWAIHYAAKSGSSETLQYLIQKLVQGKIIPPLKSLFLSSFQNSDTFPVLSRYIMQIKPLIKTPISKAAATGDLAFFSTKLSQYDQWANRSNFQEEFCSTDELGFTPLFYAIVNTQEEVANFLLKEFLSSVSMNNTNSIQLFLLDLLMQTKSKLLNTFLTRSFLASHNLIKLTDKDLFLLNNNHFSTDLKMFCSFIYRYKTTNETSIDEIEFIRKSLPHLDMKNYIVVWLMRLFDHNRFDLIIKGLQKFAVLLDKNDIEKILKSVIFGSNTPQFVAEIFKIFSQPQFELHTYIFTDNEISIRSSNWYRIIPPIQFLPAIMLMKDATFLEQLTALLPGQLDYNLQDIDFITPLHLAAFARDSHWQSRLEYMIANGAHLYSVCNAKSSFSYMNLLHISINDNHTDLMNFLLKKYGNSFIRKCEYYLHNTKFTLNVAELAILSNNFEAFPLLIEMDPQKHCNYIKSLLIFAEEEDEDFDKSFVDNFIQKALSHPEIYPHFDLNESLKELFEIIYKIKTTNNGFIINDTFFQNFVSNCKIILETLLSYGAAISFSFEKNNLEVFYLTQFQTYTPAFFSKKFTSGVLPKIFICTKEQFNELAKKSLKDAQQVLKAYSWFILNLSSQNKSTEEIQKHKQLYTSLHVSLYNEVPSLLELSSHAFFGSKPTTKNLQIYHSTKNFLNSFIELKNLPLLSSDKESDVKDEGQSPQKKQKLG